MILTTAHGYMGGVLRETERLRQPPRQCQGRAIAAVEGSRTGPSRGPDLVAIP